MSTNVGEKHGGGAHSTMMRVGREIPVSPISASTWTRVSGTASDVTMAEKTLYSLAKALGANWDPPENWKDTVAFQKQRAPSKVDCLNEALASARAAFLSSPALKYAEQRGLSSYISAVYGLGYGQPKPTISTYSWKMANESRLLIKDTWLWAGSIVYADPLITQP